MVIDTRKQADFAAGHVVGTVSIPVKYLASWAGWLVDYDKPIYLLTAKSDHDEAIRVLRKIGVEHISGYFDTEETAGAGLNVQSYQQITPAEIAPQVQSGDVILIDVRGDTEWKEEHIEQAQRCFLGKLPEKLSEYSGDCTLVFHCRSGGRSAIAAGLAQAAGVKRVINLTGGIQAWTEAGLPVLGESARLFGPNADASTVEAANQGQAVFWNAQCPPRVTVTNAPSKV
jgi:hydroxyacylglutathione hydrolase